MEHRATDPTEEPLRALAALSEAALIRSRALAIAQNILRSAWEGALLLNGLETSSAIIEEGTSLSRVQQALQQAVNGVVAKAKLAEHGTQIEVPIPGVEQLQDDLESLHRMVDSLRQEFDQWRPLVMELQSQRAQVIELELVLKQQGAVLKALQNDFAAAVSDFEGRMNTLTERIRALESGLRQLPERLIEVTTRGEKLSETVVEKDIAETTIHREQIAEQTQGVQDLSGEKRLDGAPLAGEARADGSPQLEKTVALPTTLTGDVDLILPRIADRITLEVIVAVLQEQPGVSVRKMQAYRDVLVVPVQLARPVPLVAILRELPRVTSAELVPTGFQPIGTAPLHVIVQIT